MTLNMVKTGLCTYEWETHASIQFAFQGDPGLIAATKPAVSCEVNGQRWARG